MLVSVEAKWTSSAIAALGGWLATRCFAPGTRLRSLPLAPRNIIVARPHLPRIDAASCILAAAGVVTLIAGSALEHFDYVAFVFISLSFGLGLARRLLVIALEKASLQPCP
jgi:hypothetical protein